MTTNLKQGREQQGQAPGAVSAGQGIHVIADIKPGEGRVLQCLDKKKDKDKVSARRKQAQNDIGLK